MSEFPSGLRTPLGRVRFLGASRTGTTEAWLIHVTSLALVPLALYFVWLLLNLVHMDYNGVRATLSHPIPAILLLAFVIAGLLHMELGMRSVIVDYIQGRGRAWALAANTCFCWLMAFACVYATLRIAFT
jgi:succinate dehydrogenase / fumarate reductase, membrane anchor subunit